MSNRQLTSAFSEQGLSSGEKLVLIALADTANDEGVCWPSLKTIMNKTCLGKQSVVNNIQKLEARGLLSKVYRSRKSGGRTSNKYLIFPMLNFQKLCEFERRLFSQSPEIIPPTQSPECGLGEGTQSPECGLAIEPSLSKEPSLITPISPKPKKQTKEESTDAKAYRMPEDWLHSEEAERCRDWASAKWPHITDDDLNARLLNFYNYWTSTTTKRVGWYKTWQNNCNDPARGIEAKGRTSRSGADYSAIYHAVVSSGQED